MSQEEKEDELEQELEAEQRVSRRLGTAVQRLPWWFVSAVFHALLLSVLLKFTITGPPVVTESEIIFETDIKEPVEKLEPVEVFKKLEEATLPDADIEMPSQVLRPEVDTPVVMELPTPVLEQRGVELEEIALLPTDVLSDAESLLGVPEKATIGLGEGFIPRGIGTYGKIIPSLASKVKDKAQKFEGNIHLIWLVDASRSMKDDAEAVKKRLFDLYEAVKGKGRKSILMSVLSFGKEIRLWLKPTSDIERVRKAFDRLPVDESGVENVMQAVIWCAKAFPSFSNRKTVIVILTDERGNDENKVEDALDLARAKNFTVYVVSREASFGSPVGYERYQDEDGTWKTGVVSKGPETAQREIPYMRWSWWFWGDHFPSGFGIYALSRLALYTGGSYYILESAPGDPKKPKKDEYDYDTMQLYRPSLASRKAYERSLRKEPLKKIIDDAVEQWHTQNVLYHHPFKRQDFEAVLRKIPSKIEQCERIIRRLENNRLSDKVVEKLRKRRKNLRWIANYDITLAQFYLAKHRLRQFQYSIKSYLKNKPPFYPYYTWHHKGGVYQTEEEKEDREECIKAFQALARRHPGTPWGKIGELFVKRPNSYLLSFRFYQWIPPKPGAPPRYKHI